MCGDKPGGFGDGGPVREMREAQDLVTHGVMPCRRGAGGAAERMLGAGVDGGPAKSAGSGSAKNGGTDANPDGQDKVVKREAGPVGGVQRP